jgi:hypothetical protein
VFLALQGILSSGFWWQWWLSCGGRASQSGGREGGKDRRKMAEKNWAEMVFSQL